MDAILGDMNIANETADKIRVEIHAGDRVRVVELVARDGEPVHFGFNFDVTTFTTFNSSGQPIVVSTGQAEVRLEAKGPLAPQQSAPR